MTSLRTTTCDTSSAPCDNHRVIVTVSCALQAEEKLGNTERAISTYKKALDQDSTNKVPAEHAAGQNNLCGSIRFN